MAGLTPLSMQDTLALFTAESFTPQTDSSVIGQYASSEGLTVIYDDGMNTLSASASGFYLGTVTENSDNHLHTFIPSSISLDNYMRGYNVYYETSWETVYPTENGFWVLHCKNGYKRLIQYIDLTNHVIYSHELESQFVIQRISENGRYVILVVDEYRIRYLLALDLETVTAERMDLSYGFMNFVFDEIPYFNEKGEAVLIRKTDDPDRMHAYYYYYYAWSCATINSVRTKQYDPILYVEDYAMLIVKSGNLAMVHNDEVVWTLPAEKINPRGNKYYTTKNARRTYSWQVGSTWVFQQDSNSFYTYWGKDAQARQTGMTDNSISSLAMRYVMPYASRMTGYFSKGNVITTVYDEATGLRNTLDAIENFNGKTVFNINHIICMENVPGASYAVYYIDDDQIALRNLT